MSQSGMAIPTTQVQSLFGKRCSSDFLACVIITKKKWIGSPSVDACQNVWLALTYSQDQVNTDDHKLIITFQKFPKIDKVSQGNYKMQHFPPKL